MITCAIDPGLQGGVAFLDDETPQMSVALPVLSKVVDVVSLIGLLQTMEPRRVLVERQMIRQGQGGALTIGANYGRILGALESIGMPYKIITPAQWKKAAGIRVGVTGKEKKEASYEACRRTFGGDAVAKMNLRTNKDGPCDALLIGYFGK